MEFKNEKLNCRFTVPDRPTVRQQLAFYSEFSEATGAERFERLFEAARPLITAWDCPALPKLEEIDLDKLDNPSQAQVMVWAAQAVLSHFNKLEDVPKNA